MIGILKSECSIEHQLMNWLCNENRVLFICGLSGSGKTTIAKEFAADFNAKHVCLDRYIKPLLRSKAVVFNPDLHQIAFDQGVQLLLEDNPEGKLIIEGAQVSWLNPEALKQHSYVLLRTSFLTSCYRACMRDFSKEHWKKWKTISPQTHIGWNIRILKSMREFYSAF